MLERRAFTRRCGGRSRAGDRVTRTAEVEAARRKVLDRRAAASALHRAPTPCAPADPKPARRGARARSRPRLCTGSRGRQSAASRRCGGGSATAGSDGAVVGARGGTLGIENQKTRAVYPGETRVSARLGTSSHTALRGRERLGRSPQENRSEITLVEKSFRRRAPPNPPASPARPANPRSFPRVPGSYPGRGTSGKPLGGPGRRRETAPQREALARRVAASAPRPSGHLQHRKLAASHVRRPCARLSQPTPRRAAHRSSEWPSRGEQGSP